MWQDFSTTNSGLNSCETGYGATCLGQSSDWRAGRGYAMFAYPLVFLVN
jgi:hypothetical protein